MSRTDENMISIYEREILRFIFFGGNQENGTCRRRSNLVPYQSYKESEIAYFIKIQRIKGAVHFVRMDEDHTTKIDFNTQPIGTRKSDRLNLTLTDGLEKYAPILRTKNWITLAGRRLPWKRLLEKAKAKPGLSID
ncbi:uncharacterized protein TNCV_1495161 [Trichonephila clavipes]|nr:uncharacterized protein TNCV_1495161 [Trichonephila clavipes]